MPRHCVGLVNKIKEKMIEKKKLFYEVFVEGQLKFRGSQIELNTNENNVKREMINVNTLMKIINEDLSALEDNE